MKVFHNISYNYIRQVLNRRFRLPELMTPAVGAKKGVSKPKAERKTPPTKKSGADPKPPVVGQSKAEREAAKTDRLERAKVIAEERDRLRKESTRLRQERTASWYPNAHKTPEQQEELNRQFLEADQAWLKASQQFFAALRGE